MRSRNAILTKRSICDDSFAVIKIVETNTRLQYRGCLTIRTGANAKVRIRCSYNGKSFSLWLPSESNNSLLDFQSFNWDFLLAQTEDLKVGEC